MANFTSITIIYNPNSTGGSQKLATATRRKLQAALEGQHIGMIGTEYAGHAEELAYELAHASKRPLIISTSGDGGYNEVINGLQRAQHEGARPTAGLLPAGNANDHYHCLHHGDFVQAIVHSKGRSIDILKLEITKPDSPHFTRYAHSYIGLGLTPRVGRELNKTKLSPVKEVWLVGKTFIRSGRVNIIVRGQVQTYHSLIFSNINRMAKILALTKDSTVDDGKFEVSALYNKHKLGFALQLLKAAAPGLHSTTQTTRYTFNTTRRTVIQFDGETRPLEANAKVTVTICPKALKCII